MNFFFDFGNVLYKIDHTKTYYALKRLSARPDLFNDLTLHLLLADEKVLDYERGRISTADFFDYISSLLFISDIESAKRAWLLTLEYQFDFAEDIISKFKEKGRVFLLSNTCKIHYDHFVKESGKLISLFDKCYFSHQAGMRKPEPELFLYILNDLGIEANQSFFTDDLESNLLPAAELGFKTLQFTDKEVLYNFLHTV